jgi:hypothetical protein
LQYHRLLTKLGAGELVDAQLAPAQFLQLGVEDVGGDAVGRGARLVVGKSEFTLRARRIGYAPQSQQGCGE